MSGAAVASSRRPMPPGRLALPSASQRRLLAVAALAAAVAYLSRVWSVERAAGVVLVRGLLGVKLAMTRDLACCQTVTAPATNAAALALAITPRPPSQTSRRPRQPPKRRVGN
jgi:hypothetical protein